MKPPTITPRSAGARYVIVHGHFYQPPRENPYTGEMPRELGAAPYSDYNEKILAECYLPNAERGNYSRMSFNIGPTLAAWMRRYHPDVLEKIADCDRLAIETTGYGSAIAQSYHHTILPLANERDRRTEIRWGVRSFELLYGRKPLGIWLPETAVDTPTLEACVDEGLRFTILAPGQIQTPGEPHGSYRIPLPGDRSFDAIVYDGGLGGTISFDPGATTWADTFARDRVLPNFGRMGSSPELVAVATDGEVYGHHHPFKDLFLNELLKVALQTAGIEPTTSDRYVSDHPATRQAALRERSSWGCPHELSRWADGCGCTEGSADWKRPLRDAFDRLALRVDDVYEREATKHLTDPWAARDAYIEVVDGADTFEHWYLAWRPAEGGDAVAARQLLEVQRHRLAMYASCAFYWEDVSRIEPGYGIRRGLAAAGMLDAAYGADLAVTFRRDLTRSVGWRTRESAAELHAAG